MEHDKYAIYMIFLVAIVGVVALTAVVSGPSGDLAGEAFARFAMSPKFEYTPVAAVEPTTETHEVLEKWVIDADELVDDLGVLDMGYTTDQLAGIVIDPVTDIAVGIVVIDPVMTDVLTEMLAGDMMDPAGLGDFMQNIVVVGVEGGGELVTVVIETDVGNVEVTGSVGDNGQFSNEVEGGTVSNPLSDGFEFSGETYAWDEESQSWVIVSDNDGDDDGIANAFDRDADNDGIPNGQDDDDDNDGVPDDEDDYPRDPSRSIWGTQLIKPQDFMADYIGEYVTADMTMIEVMDVMNEGALENGFDIGVNIYMFNFGDYVTV